MTFSPWVMLSPYLAGLSGLFILPLVICAGIAFTSYDGLSAPSWTGSENVQRMFRDTDLHNGVRASLFLLLLLLPLRIGAMVGLAWLLHSDQASSRLARMAVLIPGVTPDVAYALIWLFIFNPFSGPMNWLLPVITGPMDPALQQEGEVWGWLLHPVAAQLAVGLMLFWLLGESFLLVLAAARGVPAPHLEAAALAGAGSWVRFQSVTLPFIRPFLVLAVLRDTAWMLQVSFIVAVVATKGGPYYATSYLSYWVYLNATDYQRLGYAAAMTLVTLALTVLAVAAQLLLARLWSATDRA